MEKLNTCPLCGAQDLRPALKVIDHTVSRESFVLCTCGGCGYAITNPRPSPSEIAPYYISNEYISHSNRTSSLSDKIYHAVRRRTLRSKAALISQYISNGSVLDLGCGTGEFLGHLKSLGYTTQGVEPSPLARAQAENIHKLLVVPTLENLAPEARFNIITLWHVLEHVHDVRETLRLLHRFAAPGALLVIAVPDRESWDAKHYGPDWAGYDVPRHLSHFRRQDLGRFLKEVGFTLVGTRPMWYDAPYVSMLSEKYRGALPLAALLKGVVVGGLSNMVALFTSRPTSSTIFIAKKAEAN